MTTSDTTSTLPLPSHNGHDMVDDPELAALLQRARTIVTRADRATEDGERRAVRTEALDTLTAIHALAGNPDVQPDVVDLTQPVPPRPADAAEAIASLRRVLVDEQPTTRPRSRVATVLSGAVLPLGLLAIGFVAFQLWGTALTAARNQRQLTDELEAAMDEASVAAASGTGASAEPGDPLGSLQIGAIELDKVVVEGTSSTSLQRGPGHHRNTPAIGHAGNTVIVGRRSSYGRPFEHLNQLAPGDEIVALTPEGRFVYEVDEINVSPVGDEAPFEQAFGVGVLTLITSSPDQDEWLTVRAELEGDPILDEERPVVAMTDAEFSLQGDRDAWGGILLWGQLLVITWLIRRRLERVWLRWSTWLITTPLLLVFALLLFESLDRLFPPTL